MSELVLDVMPHLRGYALALTRNRAQAQDLTHDTVVRMLENAHQFEVGSNLVGWAMTIMRNAYISDRRRVSSRVEQTVDIADLLLPIAPGQDTSVECAEMLAAVARLDRHHREVLVLVAAYRDRYEAVADQLGVPVGTVKSRLHRAREALREAMG